jgi:hypothetical protein
MRKSIALAAALALLAMLAGCNHHDDTALATNIKAKMFSDPDLKVANLDVSVKDGVATVSGSVPQAPIKQRALQLASSEPGVKSVNDQVSAPGSAPAGAPGSPAPAEQPVTAQVPADTLIPVRTERSIDSSLDHAGQTFPAALAEPVTVGDLVLPPGTGLTLLLTEDKRTGHFKGRSEVRVTLDSLVFQDQTYHLDTTSVDERGKSRGKNTAAKVGIGAAAGGLIGGLVGGGKGAAIGLGAGAGVGAGSQLLTHGQKVRIPAESQLDFRLREPVTITYLRSKLTANGQ